jgi:hypothetical protein
MSEPARHFQIEILKKIGPDGRTELSVHDFPAGCQRITVSLSGSVWALMDEEDDGGRVVECPLMSREVVLIVASGDAG